MAHKARRRPSWKRQRMSEAMLALRQAFAGLERAGIKPFVEVEGAHLEKTLFPERTPRKRPR